MRRSAFPLALPPVLIALGVAVSQIGPSFASEVRSFLLAPAEGYGVQECLEAQGECGPAMADAWCQSQGRTRAVSYGPSLRPTDAAPGDALREVQPSAYVITCGD